LHRQGWTISAIAPSPGADRKTIRAYLRDGREPGVRSRAAADPFGPFAAYRAARLAEDPRLWATALFDEVTGLGFGRSYPAFTRQLRARGLRPHCEPCHPAKGRAVAVIEHPPGDEGYPDYAIPGGKRLRGHLLLVTLSRERRAEGGSQYAAGGHDLVREPPAMALVVGQ
jgi:hypothetical protein